MCFVCVCVCEREREREREREQGMFSITALPVGLSAGTVTGIGFSSTSISSFFRPHESIRVSAGHGELLKKAQGAGPLWIKDFQVALGLYLLSRQAATQTHSLPMSYQPAYQALRT